MRAYFWPVNKKLWIQLQSFFNSLQVTIFFLNPILTTFIHCFTIQIKHFSFENIYKKNLFIFLTYVSNYFYLNSFILFKFKHKHLNTDRFCFIKSNQLFLSTGMHRVCFLWYTMFSSFRIKKLPIFTIERKKNQRTTGISL